MKRKHVVFATVSATALALPAFGPALAASDYLLELDDVAGDTAPQPTIHLAPWSSGACNPPPPGPGRAAATVLGTVLDVEVTADATDDYTATVDSGGHRSIIGIDASNLHNGPITYDAVQTDTDGNESETTGEIF